MNPAEHNVAPLAPPAQALKEATNYEARTLAKEIIGLRVAALMAYTRVRRRHIRPWQIEHRVHDGWTDAAIRQWIDTQGLISTWFGRLFRRE